MPLQPGDKTAHTKSLRLSVRVEWATSTRPANAWTELSRSKSPRPSSVNDLNAKLVQSRRSITPISANSTTMRPVEQPLKPLVRLDVDVGADMPTDLRGAVTAILSPDGMRLVYMPRSKLFTRRLDQPAREGAYGPFFSPDGQRMAFFDGKKLKKISAEGGPATPEERELEGVPERPMNWALG